MPSSPTTSGRRHRPTRPATGARLGHPARRRGRGLGRRPGDLRRAGRRSAPRHRAPRRRPAHELLVPRRHRSCTSATRCGRASRSGWPVRSSTSACGTPGHLPRPRSAVRRWPGRPPRPRSRRGGGASRSAAPSARPRSKRWSRRAARSAGALATRALALGHEAVAVSPTGSLAALAGEVEQWRRPAGSLHPRSAPGAAGRAGAHRHPGRRARLELRSRRRRPGRHRHARLRPGRRRPLLLPGRRGCRLTRPAARWPTVTARPYGSADTEVDLHRIGRLGSSPCSPPWLAPRPACRSTSSPTPRAAWWPAWPWPTRPMQGRCLRALGAVVTLGTPHQGADLATALTAVGAATPAGRAIAVPGRQAAGVDLDLDPTRDGPAERDLGRDRRAGPPGPGRCPPRVGRAPAATSSCPTSARWRRAPTTSPSTSRPHAHDRLPAAPATTREIGLAIAGAPPTCADLAQGTRRRGRPAT